MRDERLIDAAVNWWANKIADRHHHDNGATDDTNIMIMLMADMLYQPAAPEQIERFKSVLKERIKERDEEGRKKIWLDTDYTPCRDLQDAANESGISLTNFPFKTAMVIEENRVRVSDGYAQPFEELRIDEQQE